MMYSAYFIGGPFDLTKRATNGRVEVFQYFYLIDEEHRCSARRWEYGAVEKDNLKKHEYKLMFRRETPSRDILIYEYVGVSD